MKNLHAALLEVAKKLDGEFSIHFVFHAKPTWTKPYWSVTLQGRAYRYCWSVCGANPFACLRALMADDPLKFLAEVRGKKSRRAGLKALEKAAEGWESLSFVLFPPSEALPWFWYSVNVHDSWHVAGTANAQSLEQALAGALAEAREKQAA